MCQSWVLARKKIYGYEYQVVFTQRSILINAVGYATPFSVVPAVLRARGPSKHEPAPLGRILTRHLPTFALHPMPTVSLG